MYKRQVIPARKQIRAALKRTVISTACILPICVSLILSLIHIYNLTSSYFNAAHKLYSKKARRRIIAYVESYDDVAFWRTSVSYTHLDVYKRQEFVEGIVKGDITILSQAVTLVESVKPEHQVVAQEVIEKCLPHSGNSCLLYTSFFS